MESRQSMAALDYPPHVTLAVYDHIPLDLLRVALRRGVRRNVAGRLMFQGRVSSILSPGALGRPFALCGAGQRARAGAHLHRSRAVSPALPARPWVPHCTLGTLRVAPEHRDEASSVCRPSHPAISKSSSMSRTVLPSRRWSLSTSDRSPGSRSRGPSSEEGGLVAVCDAVFIEGHVAEAGCLGLLPQHSLMAKNPAPGHGEGHAEPLRDGAIRQPLGAQLVGALVEIGALAAHGLT